MEWYAEKMKNRQKDRKISFCLFFVEKSRHLLKSVSHTYRRTSNFLQNIEKEGGECS